MNFAGLTLADKYRIIRPIAKGAVATVFLAFDQHGVPYALKAFPPGFEGRADREYKVGRILQHSRINPVLERFSIEKDGLNYPSVLLTFAPGTRLSEWRRDNPTQLIFVFGQMLEALAFMHSKGIVHRDIKPENLVVDSSGDARLLDFDLSGPITEKFPQKVRLGTIGYISPEQVAGRSPTFASDLYSAGVVLYWLVSGELPFSGVSEEVMWDHGQTQFPDLVVDSATNIKKSRQLVQFIHRLTAKNPLERYAHGGKALEDWLGVLSEQMA